MIDLEAMVERLRSELESAEENINSLHVYWKGAEVRAEKSEAKLDEAMQRLTSANCAADLAEAKLAEYKEVLKYVNSALEEREKNGEGEDFCLSIIKQVLEDPEDEYSAGGKR